MHCVNDIESVLLLEQEWKDEIKNIIASNCSLVLVGNGSTSDFIVSWFKKNNINPVCFCDNSKDKQGKMSAGCMVYSVEAAILKYPSANWYITTQMFYTTIYNQLISLGVNEKKIIKYDLVPQFDWEHDYKQYIIENKNKFIKTISMLEDNYSKKVFLNRLAFLITRRREYVVSIRSKHQYFETELIDYSTIKNFIDVGAYIGDTILDFNKYNDLRNCHVYAFELDKKLLLEAIDNTKHISDKITFINKALSDSVKVGKVQSSLGVMKSIDEKMFSDIDKESDTEEFDMVSLDSQFCDCVDSAFIKMDIEGAEMAALSGGNNFIKNNMPIIAICVYHKKDDIWNIVEKIKEYFSKYKFYLRHYSDNQTETVLYAVPVDNKGNSCRSGD